MYNVKKINYPSGAQIRVYSRLVDAPDYNEKIKDVDNISFDLELDVWYQMSDSLQSPFDEVEEDEKKFDRSLISSLNRSKNKIYYLARSNMWEWFFTLTFNPVEVDSMNYDSCTKKLSVWLNNMRKICPDMVYLFVPEKHKSGRYHFHGVVSHCDGLDFVDSGHADISGNTIYNVGKYRFGWSTATRVKDAQATANYLCKYITKDLGAVSSGKKRYWASRNIQKAEEEEFTVENVEDLKKLLYEQAKHVSVSGLGEYETLYFEMDGDNNDKSN